MAFAEGTNPYAQMSNPYAAGAPSGPPGGAPPGGAPGGYPPPGGAPPSGYPPAGDAPGGYPPPGGAPGGYPPPGGAAPGGYPAPGGAPGGYPPPGGAPPGGAPGGYPPPGGAPGGYPPAGDGGYPPAGGAPAGYPPPGGAPGGYPPGQEDLMKGAAGAPGGFKMPDAIANMTGKQQAMAGVAGLALAGGAAYAGNKYYQNHHQQGGQQPPPQQAAYPGQSGGGYPQPQGGSGGGYPNYHQGGASTATYAGGGALTGAALGAAGTYAYQQYQQHQNPGQPQQTNWQQVAMGAAAGGAGGALLGFGAGKFFNHVGTGTNRDYVIIVDRSGSMNINDTDKDGLRCTRWDNARRAVELLAPKVTQCDSDGVTLYLFSRQFQKFEGIKNPGQVQQIFQSNGPQGSTNLAAVLNSAFGDFFRKGKPMTILVITDGEPDSEEDAKREIEQASNRLRQDADLSITFVQVGDDQGATRYLQSLDDQLRCKFDIVDTVKDEDLRRLGFEQLIAKSIGD